MMYGRYGNDELNKFLVYVSFAIIILNIFIRVRVLSLLTVICLIVIFSRAMSRCFDKRQAENMKFLELKNKFFNRSSGGFNRSRGSFGSKNKNSHGFGNNGNNDGKRVLICPYCKEKLRVPVGAGKIKINCPYCRRQFEETV